MFASLVRILVKLYQHDHRLYALVALVSMLASGVILTLVVETATRLLGYRLKMTDHRQQDPANQVRN